MVELDNFRCVHCISIFLLTNSPPSLAVTGSTAMKTIGQLFPYSRFFGYLFLGVNYLNHTVVSVLGFFVLWNRHTGSVERLLSSTRILTSPHPHQQSLFSLGLNFAFVLLRVIILTIRGETLL